jgi:hypothetical protein
MDTLDVYLDQKLAARGVTLATAADFCKLDPSEIA